MIAFSGIAHEISGIVTDFSGIRHEIPELFFIFPESNPHGSL